MQTEDSGKHLKDFVRGRLTSVLFIGGYRPDMTLDGSAHPFVGCIKGLRLASSGDVNHRLQEQTTMMMMGRRPTLQWRTDDVIDGCVDPCSRQTEEGGDEQGEGRGGDEEGRGSEGSYPREGCPGNDADLTSLTLHGSEWLLYNVYDDSGPTDRHIHWHSMAIQFKMSSVREGILFYAWQLYPSYNHLAISVHNATLHVSIIFPDQTSYSELFVSIGNRLDDNRWHELTIRHVEQSVDVTLDLAVEKMYLNRPDDVRLHLPPFVYFGGIDVSANMLGLRSQRNFVGCLRGLVFNDDSILDALPTTTTTTSSRIRYHGKDGPMTYGCHLELGKSALQFSHEGAFAKIEHPYASSSFSSSSSSSYSLSNSSSYELQMKLRTMKADCIIVHVESSNNQAKNFLQVAVRSGHLATILKASSVFSDKNDTLVAIDGQVNDNQWHYMRLAYDSGRLLLEVDGLRRIEQVVRNISIGESTYLGFDPNSDMKSAFVGCMKKVRLQGLHLNPIEVMHSQLGVGITVGECTSSNEGGCGASGRASSAENRSSPHCSSSIDEGTWSASAVTFDRSAESGIVLRMLAPEDLLRTVSISLGIRRCNSRSSGLLMLANDISSSSLIVQLHGNDSIALRRRIHNSIHEATASFPGLATTEWKRLTVSMKNNHVVEFSVNEARREFHLEAQDDTFDMEKEEYGGRELGARKEQESDVPDGSGGRGVKEEDLARPHSDGSISWTVYVGGQPGDFLVGGGYVGCISTLRINQRNLNLIDASQGMTGIASGCQSNGRQGDDCRRQTTCHQNGGCHNGGLCMSDSELPWQRQIGDCDCTQTGWAGPRCSDNLQVLFSGQSLLVETLKVFDRFDLVDETMSDGRGFKTEVYFTFATSSAFSSPAKDHPSMSAASMALLSLHSIAPEAMDYMIVYLTGRGCLGIIWSIDDTQVILTTGDGLMDTNPHRVSASRYQDQFHLQVDGSVSEIVLNGSSSAAMVAMDAPRFLVIGGVLPNVSEHFRQFVNFTGVIANVFVRSDHLETTNSRPIEVFFGYPDGHNGVAIEGRLRQIHAFSALPLLHGDNNNDDSSSPPPIPHPPHPPLPSPPSIPTPPPPPSDAFLRDMYSSSDELSGEDLVDAADRLGHGERIIVIGIIVGAILLPAVMLVSVFVVVGRDWWHGTGKGNASRMFSQRPGILEDDEEEDEEDEVGLKRDLLVAGTDPEQFTASDPLLVPPPLQKSRSSKRVSFALHSHSRTEADEGQPIVCIHNTLATFPREKRTNTGTYMQMTALNDD